MNFAIFVLDSVLFDSRHRQQLVPKYQSDSGEQRAAQWSSYWAQCLGDTPLPALTMAAALLNQGIHLVLTSGRPDHLLEQTRAKVRDAMLKAGADLEFVDNITYDLRATGENYVDKVGNMIDQLVQKEGQLIVAIVKNRGLVSSLRRQWPMATVCNVGVETSKRP